MEQKAVIMDENAMRRAVARITYEILERNRGAENLCIVGILSRGVVLAERIARKIYEPMNGLDKDGVQDMRRYLLHLKEQGKTILLASHSAEDISVLCDTVCEMDKGKLTIIS